jgi:cell wall assembly regulator SMI1
MATYWRDLIERTYADVSGPGGTASKPRFSPPASAEDIAAAERQLGRKLPPSLTSLLMETDGVMDMMSVGGGDYFEDMWLIWPTERTVMASLEDRSQYVVTPSDADTSGLVFFADAGVDGILFAFPPASADTCDTKVVVWHPLRGTVSDLADSLEAFIAGWLTGRLTV